MNSEVLLLITPSSFYRIDQCEVLRQGIFMVDLVQQFSSVISVYLLWMKTDLR